MKGEGDRFAEAFREEVLELLTGLEGSLLELEKTPDNYETISSVFRAFHTIKGSSAMYGFDEISEFTHQIETAYDLVRKGEVKISKFLIDLSLSSCDLIRGMLDHQTDSRTEAVLSSLKSILPQAGGDKREHVPSAFPVSDPAVPYFGKEETYRIRFRPFSGIFLSGTNPLLIMKELRGLGECRIIAHTDLIPELGSLDPEACYTHWDIILTTDRGVNAVRDVFMFVEGECELDIDLIDSEDHPDALNYRRLGEILVEKKELGKEGLEKILTAGKLTGEFLIDEGLVRHGSIRAALAEQHHVRRMRENRKKSQVISSIRVVSGKLDKLVNLVGELVTVQARLSRFSALRNDPMLASISEEVERLTAEIRDRTMNIRMVPIGTLFSRFGRLVRDLSHELGKEVEVVMEGAETELDKTIIEKLNDPLIHLIRNCIDHGIETPQARVEAGKVKRGTIHLSASHSGDNVLIEIKDDGAGLDTGEIRNKAVEQGLISPTAEISEKEIFSLVFLPGFSTAGRVTNISGRGVGMDVVKKSVDSLRGSIELTSIKGSGTAVALRLPLTMAIIDGLLVKAGGEEFVLPLSFVEGCIELKNRNGKGSYGRRIVNVRGEAVPYISMREHFFLPGEPPATEQVVIVRSKDLRIGFVVDNVIGGHQTVIKSLGKVFREIEGISGATIMGDGSVVLIIDIPALIKIAKKEVTA